MMKPEMAKNRSTPAPHGSRCDGAKALPCLSAATSASVWAWPTTDHQRGERPQALDGLDLAQGGTGLRKRLRQPRRHALNISYPAKGSVSTACTVACGVASSASIHTFGASYWHGP